MKLASISLCVAASMAQCLGQPLQVASLNSVLTEIAQEVGGDKVSVIGIIKPGMDPHEFTPSTDDIKIISKSAVVFLSGYGLEDTYLTKLQKSAGPGPVFVSVGKFIKPLLAEPGEDDGHDHAHGTASAGEKVPDPHWWHSIKNAKIATVAIRDAFIQADPANKAAYEDGAAAYEKKLTALEKWARLEIAGLPRQKRVLVTSHDAFAYFAQDYGFTVYPIAGISTDDQPSSKKVRAIIDEIKKEGVRSIFLESMENPKVLAEITKETGAKTGGVLYADGLGDKEANTYESMIRHNYSAIVNALK